VVVFRTCAMLLWVGHRVSGLLEWMRAAKDCANYLCSEPLWLTRASVASADFLHVFFPSVVRSAERHLPFYVWDRRDFFMYEADAALPLMEGEDACGQPLEGGPLTHTLTPVKGAAGLRLHHDVKHALASPLRREGAYVDFERHFSHLFQFDQPGQRFIEALLDAVAYWPGASLLRPTVVTLFCLLAARNAAVELAAGAAATTAERRRRLGRLARHRGELERILFFTLGVGVGVDAGVCPMSSSTLRTRATFLSSMERRAGTAAALAAGDVGAYLGHTSLALVHAPPPPLSGRGVGHAERGLREC
jgi:hypothetical protein